jgi:hypothetical protein
MRRLIFPILMVLATAAFAQKTAPAPVPATATTTAPATIVTTDSDARDSREQFKELLRRTPPEVGKVLKLDPTLFNNEPYLATYPALAAFVKQHPEVAHNPAYYLEDVWIGDRDPRTSSARMWEETMEGIFIFAIFSTIVGVLTWLIRMIIEQRRWSRLSRVQTEVHGKVLERLTSNDEMLRYMETPAGRRFLESAPIPVDTASRQVSAPIGKILWSIQMGLVVAAAGIGLSFVSTHIDKDASQPIYALGVVAISVGVGFVLSAIVSFILSRRLRLFEPPEVSNV